MDDNWHTKAEVAFWGEHNMKRNQLAPTRKDNDNATMPTRAEMCADLARAMFPTAVIEPSLSDSGVDIRIYDKPNETRSWRDFDPFTNADDKDALVARLAEDDALNGRYFKHLCRALDIIPTWIEGYSGPVYSLNEVKRLMAAPLPVITEAAWRAIQEEAKCE